MPKALDGQIVMEKTPRYFVTVETPVRVHAMSQDVKLIVVVRDPVTRAISDYTQIISKAPDIPAFESLAFKNRTTGTDPAVWVWVFWAHTQYDTTQKRQTWCLPGCSHMTSTWFWSFFIHQSLLSLSVFDFSLLCTSKQTQKQKRQAAWDKSSSSDNKL